MQSDNMMKRLLIFGIGTSLIQVIGFYLLILIVYWFAAAINYSSIDSSGDYNMLFTAILFAIIVLIQNVFAAVINRRKVTYVLMVLAIVSYTASLIDIGISVPFKTGLCMILGIVVLGVKMRIDDRLVK